MSVSKVRPIKVLIGVPSGRAMILTHAAAAIVKTVLLLSESGIKLSFLNIDSAEIIVARNMLATYAVLDPEITHLLFIDDDMSFDADTVMELLRADKPVIGCVYPKRGLDLERFHAAVRAGADLDAATTAALDFVVKIAPGGRVEVEDGLFQVAGLGMGVTLIKTQTLQTMIDKKVVRIHRFPGEGVRDSLGNPHHFGFFDQIYQADIASPISEDLSFCQRWRDECGGEVWAMAHHKVGHVGQFVFAGRYFDRLVTGAT